MALALPDHATVAEAAAKLGVTIGRIHQLLTEKRLPAERCGRQLVIPRDKLNEFAEQPRPIGRPRKQEKVSV